MRLVGARLEAVRIIEILRKVFRRRVGRPSSTLHFPSVPFLCGHKLNASALDGLGTGIARFWDPWCGNGDDPNAATYANDRPDCGDGLADVAWLRRAAIRRRRGTVWLRCRCISR